MLIKLDDAIAAYMQRRFGGSEEVVAALRALPVSDGVTDEMCLHAGNVFHDALTSGKSAPEAMRAALEAALGPLPAPPTIE